MISETEQEKAIVTVKAEVSELKWETDVDFTNLNKDAIWYMVGLVKMTNSIQKVRIHASTVSRWDEENGRGKMGELLIHIRFENQHHVDSLKELGVVIDTSQIELAYRANRDGREREVAELQARKHIKDVETRTANWDKLPMVVLAETFSKGGLFVVSVQTKKTNYIENGFEPSSISYSEKYKGQDITIYISRSHSERYEVRLFSPQVSTSGNSYGRRRYTSEANETHRCKKVEKAVELIHTAITDGRRIIDSRQLKQQTRVTLQKKYEALLQVTLIPDTASENKFSIQYLKDEKDKYSSSKGLTILVSDDDTIRVVGLGGKYSVDAVKTILDLLRNAQY
jgi:hypothetical protein